MKDSEALTGVRCALADLPPPKPQGLWARLFAAVLRMLHSKRLRLNHWLNERKTPVLPGATARSTILNAGAEVRDLVLVLWTVRSPGTNQMCLDHVGSLTSREGEVVRAVAETDTERFEAEAINNEHVPVRMRKRQWCGRGRAGGRDLLL